MPTLPRLTLSGIIAGLLLAGCAHQPAARTTPKVATTSTTATTSTPATAGSSSAVRSPRHSTTPATPKGHVTVENVNLPAQTGIPACDDYLSSYMACHRAAGIYTADQLPKRYEAMRTSLLLDSENPDIRPQLAARCNSLAVVLREALNGKSCAVNPAPAGSTP
ncbi:hypothetical protein [Rhodanobacter sp. C03]|uniref:hypothetical protein n=1 Tax=Rhodanobacter sp. C03 TaxID=1945858 RepID=UPI000986C206|nr:hypothetical protein [Rhodanobacter sp. C03]OOG58391.1 hypothetical protein B0E48_06285 [Rhodanobacter sp. C03]